MKKTVGSRTPASRPHILSRSEYERLFAETGVYPKTTPQAVMELRTRGLDCKSRALDHLVRRGIVEPRTVGGDLRWEPRHVDTAAAYLDHRNEWTPGAQAANYDAYALADDIEALQRAAREFPGVPPESLVKVIGLSAPGVGITATVRYRLPTAEERAEFEAKVEARRRPRVASAPAVPAKLAAMLAGLRSADQDERHRAGYAVAIALARGQRDLGAAPADADRVRAVVAPLVERAVAGDIVAVDELEQVLTADVLAAQAPGPVERSARERGLSDRRSASEEVEQ